MKKSRPTTAASFFKKYKEQTMCIDKSYAAPSEEVKARSYDIIIFVFSIKLNNQRKNTFFKSKGTVYLAVNK